MRLAGIVDQSIVDGPGLRLTVFAQGCLHGCPGCHNPATHALDAGDETSVRAILARYDRNPLLAGVTLSGGEPLLQPAAMAALASAVRERGGNVWCYTGYTLEEALELSRAEPEVGTLLALVDVLVDGRFDLSRQSLSLRHRGSANQRVLDLPRSLDCGRAVPLPA